MNPLRDGGGGKEDTLTTRGDGPSIYRAEAPYNNTYHPLRGGRGDVHGCYVLFLWSIDILVERRYVVLRGVQRIR